MKFDLPQIALTAVSFIPLIIAVVCHEYAHGWVAFRLGDPTAKLQGRLTLNPLKHVHWFGSIVLPVSLALLRITPIGFAKPVPIDPRYFRNFFRDFMLVAIAGPLTNFAIAAVALLAWHGLDNQFNTIQQWNSIRSDEEFLRNGTLLLAMGLNVTVLINILLGLFNLIPIPPLDGSRILMFLLPEQGRLFLIRIERFALIILFGFVLMSAIFNLHIISSLFKPIINWLEGTLLGVQIEMN
ncbi:site-2 protease family protein [Candidatus Acetothermia bacterium]|nr:site-2 protease family protein [Candidatus Acetothermia bacterium]MBI3461356.1 site-2 protease family protein [Candidatus Acetothermia bacterium]